MQAPLPYMPQPLSPWPVELGQLKTLAICHYVWGGISIAISSIFIFHIVIGVMMLRGSSFMAPTPGGPPPQLFAWMIIGMGSLAVLLGWTTGILTIVAGRSLASQRRRIFTMVMAGVNCLAAPFGTTLGVFTLVILSKESVQALYAYRAYSEPA